MAKVLYTPEGGEFPKDSFEREALMFLKEKLPDDWYLLANFLLYPDDEQTNLSEFDIIVLSPHAIHVIETKKWHRTLSGSGHHWKLNGQSLGVFPFTNAVEKCKKLKTFLREEIKQREPRYTINFWTASVFVVPAATTVEYTEENNKWLFPLSEELVTWLKQDRTHLSPEAQRVNLPPEHIDMLKDAIQGAWGQRQRQPRSFIGNYEITYTVTEERDIGYAVYLAKNALFSEDHTLYRIRSWKRYVQGLIDGDRMSQQQLLAYRPSQLIASIRSSITRDIDRYLANVRALTYDNFDGEYIEIMEWSSFGTLEEYFKQTQKKNSGHPPFSLPEILCIVESLATILESMHAQNICYRNLRLDTILLHNRTHPQLCDFDYACATNDNPEQILSVPEKQTNYTPHQWFNSPPNHTKLPAEPHADIHALGVILYQLLTSKWPFSDRKEQRESNSIPKKLVSQLSNLKTIWGNLMDDLDQLCIDLLTAQPERRPSATATRQRIQLIRENFLPYSVNKIKFSQQEQLDSQYAPDFPLEPNESPAQSDPLPESGWHQWLESWPENASIHIIENQEWHHPLELKGITTSPEQIRTLIFRNCTFHAPFVITQCKLLGFNLWFEQCEFKQTWNGGNRSGRGNQASQYRGLVFKECLFHGNINLTESTMIWLRFTSCSQTPGRLLLRHSRIQHTVIEQGRFLKIDATGFQLSHALTLHNTQCRELCLSEIDISPSENAASVIPPKIRILQQCQIETLQLLKTSWPSLQLHIEDATVTRLLAGYDVFKGKTKTTTLGSLAIHRSQIQELNLHKSAWTGTVSLQYIQGLKSLFMKSAKLRSDFSFSDCDSLPNITWDEAIFDGSIACTQLRCAAFSALKTHAKGTSASATLWMEQIHVAEDCVWKEALIKIPATWQRCTFAQRADFEQTHWQDLNWGSDRKNIHKEVQCLGETVFTKATFNGKTHFSHCTFQKTATFDRAKFLSTKKEHHFFYCTFQGDAQFKDIQVQGALLFSHKDTLPSETNTTFVQDFVCTLSAQEPSEARPKLNIVCNAVVFKRGASFQVEGYTTTLDLRRIQAHPLHIQGTYHLINLHKAQIQGIQDRPLLQNIASGKIRMHGCHMKNVSLHFSSDPHALDSIDLFARHAHFDNTSFTGKFVGRWHFIDSHFNNAQWHNLTMHSDMDLSGCTILQEADVVAFSHVQFEKMDPIKKTRGPKKEQPVQPLQLSIRRSSHLENLQFADGCNFDVLNLRGSTLYSCEMRNGRCNHLLVRRGLHNRTIQLRLQPEAFASLKEAYIRSQKRQPGHATTQPNDPTTYSEADWILRIQQHLMDLFARSLNKGETNNNHKEAPPNIKIIGQHEDRQNNNDESSFQQDTETPASSDAVSQETHPTTPPTDELVATSSTASSRGSRWIHVTHVSQVTTEQIEQAHAQQFAPSQTPHDTHDPGMESAPPETLTQPYLYDDQEDDVFYIMQPTQQTQQTQQDRDDKNLGIEIDIAHHQQNPFPYIQREIEHHYRSTQITDWSISDFVIDGSDRQKTPWGRPLFHNVRMTGATVKGTLFEGAILEGPFHAEAASTWHSTSWEDSEFRGPVFINNSSILGFLNAQQAVFLAPVSLLGLSCQGAIQFQRARFRSELYVSGNQLTDSWYLDEAQFAGPVLWENERGSWGLQCVGTEFNSPVQMRNATWKGEIQLQQAFFAKECLFKDVVAHSITTRVTPHAKTPRNISHPPLTQFKGPLFLRNVSLKSHLSWMYTRFASSLVLEDIEVDNLLFFLACECSQDVVIQHPKGKATLSIIRCSFSERLVLEDPLQLHTIFLGRSLCYGPLIIRGTLVPQDDISANNIPDSKLDKLVLSEMRCLQDVSLENLALDQSLTFAHSTFAADLLLNHIKFYGEMNVIGPQHDVRMAGFIEIKESEIHNQLRLQDIYQASVTLDVTTIRKELDLRSFTGQSPLFCSLANASISQISFPEEPERSLRFAQTLLPQHTKERTIVVPPPSPAELEESSHSSRVAEPPIIKHDDAPKKSASRQHKLGYTPEVHQQRSQHYAQLFELSLQRKQYQEARHYRSVYRQALKELRFGDRYRYLKEVYGQEENHGGKIMPPVQASSPSQTVVTSVHVPKPSPKRTWLHSLMAFWHSLSIQFGGIYDGYGRYPWLVLFWLLMMNVVLCIPYGFYGWGLDTLAVTWLDALLSPIGLFFQGMGLAPLGTKPPTFAFKIYFFAHCAVLGLMWLNFVVLLFPWLISRDKISKLIARRTGNS